MTGEYGDEILLDAVRSHEHHLYTLLWNGDFALWVRGGGTRKEHTCAVTGEPIPKGSRAYAPIGNQMYRMMRISQQGIDALLREAGQ